MEQIKIGSGEKDEEPAPGGSVFVVGLILLVAFGLLIWEIFSPERADVEETCTLRTIEGTYVFEARGSVRDDAGNVQAYAEAGVWTLDGEGNAAGVISVSIDGENFVTREPFTAEYRIVADCVFEVTDEFGLVVDLYATRSGSTITYYSPGFSGTMFRR